MKILKYLSISLILSVSIWECEPAGKENPTQITERNKEAREDSVKLTTAYDEQAKIITKLFATVETEPVRENANEDAADDPAIWRNNQHPNRSIIFGTNKKSGVHAYDLDGNELKFYPFGKVNNIDVRQNVKIGNKTLDILGGSNRTDNSVILYGIDTTGVLYNILESNFRIDTTDIDEVYGFCLYKNQEQQAYVIVNGKNGKINQYQLVTTETNTLSLELENSWKLKSQPEGMVADDETGNLYIGEEETGIWKLSLVNRDIPVSLLPESQQENNSKINYDIEGLSIYYGPSSTGYLIASIQGSFSYAIFDRITNDYLGSFKISGNEHIDGVEETDGLDIFSFSFSDQFSQGILVVQDGFNYADSTMQGQNFKYLKLEELNTIIEGFRGQQVVP